MKKYLSIYFHVLALVCILFFPFEFHFYPFQHSISRILFQTLTEKVHLLVFHQSMHSFDLISDSPSLYSLIIVFFILSLFFSFILSYIPQIKQKKTEVFIQKTSSYYVALVLFKYGVFKIFHTQFYAPEPNVLFTPLGLLDKDILYWSIMGSSYPYNVFMGIIEITASILLLYSKTRVLGLLISLGTIINILAVNFGFNISVKCFGFLLLFLNVISLQNFIQILIDFFVKGRSVSLNHFPLFIKNQKLYIMIKSFVILMMLLESFYPQISNFVSKQNNMKTSAAYELLNRNDSNSKLDIKRLFIHSHDYLILQFQNDSMQDYKLEIDTLQRQFIIQDYSNKIFNLNYKKYTKDSLIIQLPDIDFQKFKAIDLTTLPVIK